MFSKRIKKKQSMYTKSYSLQYWRCYHGTNVRVNTKVINLTNYKITILTFLICFNIFIVSNILQVKLPWFHSDIWYTHYLGGMFRFCFNMGYKYLPAKVSYNLQTFGIALGRWLILYK